MHRIERELELLKAQFPNAILSPQRDWVEVPDFSLPDNLYDREAVRVRMPLSPAYPDAAPDNFFVFPGLALRGGGTLDGYASCGKFGEMWGQFSWHPRLWRAAAEIERGDNMATFFNSIRKRIEEGR